MAAGDATSADVPGKFDCVINGKGYVFADSIESSLPFRTHRAIYDITQTFVERQNVGSVYGDQAQDFFLTSSQDDWSEGEDQRFFRLQDQDSKRKYWRSTNADISVPGQVTILPATKTVTFAAAVSGVGTNQFPFFAASSTNLYEYDGATITDRGAHGAGGLPTSIAFDGTFIYLAGPSTTALRKYDTGAHTFATFNAATWNSVTFLNNALWATGSGTLTTFDTAGTATTEFTWKNAVGTALGSTKRIVPFGGQIAVLVPSTQNVYAAEIWLGDTTGAQRVAELPRNFSERAITQTLGVLFIIGAEFLGAARGYRTAVYYLANGTLGKLWNSPTYTTATFGGQDIVPYQDGLLFTDIVSNTIKYYNLTTGAISSFAAWTPTTNDVFFSATGSGFAIMTQNATTTTYFFDSTVNSSATVSSSLMDFDNSLAKVFRGVKVDWTPGSDGNGGSVDIAYQVDSLDGAYTTLQSSAVSGTEYNFSGVTGHAISIKITLNKGTSTLGPTLKRVYVRAAPTLQQFKSGTYIIDCTGSPDEPRELRDGSYHPLTGYEQVQNLLTAAKSTAPFSVTDKVNGTFTALVDLSDSEGWDVYEIHPNTNNPEKAGSYFVRIKVREV